MRSLSIDIETYSDVSLNDCGVYRYCESPAFEILLFAYSVDDGPVSVSDLAQGETIPDEIREAIVDENVIKWAYNAMFERICLSRMLGMPTGTYLKPDSWRCSMVWAAAMGLPLSLEGVGAVIGLERQKLAEGKELVRYFCKPSSDGRRHLPDDAPDKWEAFRRYNIRDVEAENGIRQKLARFPLPEFVWKEYAADQEINDRGVLLDTELVRQAIGMDELTRKELTDAMKEITELENPNSVLQMRQWLAMNGMETETLDKKAVEELLKEAPERIRGALLLRRQLARSSVKKYRAMANSVCADGRARGMFRFMGAPRTGRFSGRLIQLQNLPQNRLADIDTARKLVRSGDHEAVKLLYEDVPDTLAQLIRTAFIPSAGNKFIVADYSAIEARVIAWYAGEEWRQKVFAQGGDIYCASASEMFSVPVEKHGINGHLRQKGKIAELALGYGGSTGALISMGALDLGLTEDELQPLVDAWRNANPHIVRFWKDVDTAVKEAVCRRHPTMVGKLAFAYRSGMLFITLPSGRDLVYVKPKPGINRFGGESITYEGTGATKKWERIESYGPKFVENIVQATSRDVLCHAMLQLKDRDIVMHIHDEIVLEADESMDPDEICGLMCRLPDWADGLLLRAEGFETPYYRKD